MQIAYFDCPSGISGDMTLAALVDAGVELAAIQAGIDSLGLPSCRLVASEVKRAGFRATHVDVEHEPEHAHRHLHHITDMIDASRLSDRQKDLAKRIFTRLGEAEAKVHGTTIRKVHFHEVGAVDSIADVVGAAIGIDLLGTQRLYASAVPTGAGFIEIAHGRTSVPAPATAELLTGIPLAPSTVEAELTTPTGAAILSTVVQQFGSRPAMTIRRIGYGAGSRDFPGQANILRLLVGELAEDRAPAATTGDTVWLVETNLDDVTGEAIGYAIDRLWQAGALDVYTTAIQMKKNRPGVTLSALCAAAELNAIETIILRETTALGLRRQEVRRRKLPRRPQQVPTPYGPIDGVAATLDDGATRFSPEYESCRRAAAAHGVSFSAVYQAAQGAYTAGGPTSS